MLLLTFYISVLLSSVLGQLDLSICGNNNVACFRDTENCGIAQCSAVATYQYDKAYDKVIIVLWGRQKWVAFGQRTSSSGDFMVNIRGQYCVRSGTVFLGNFNGNSLPFNGRPQWVAKGNDTSLLESKEMADGSFFCRFERPTTLSDSNFYDLNKPLYAAIAFGSNIDKDNNPSYHGNSYRYSGQTINFLTSLYTAGKNSTISTAIPPTNTLITTTGSTSSELPDLSKCDKDFNCFRYPNGCSSNCVMVATFFYDKSINKYVNELWSTTSNKWVAFAQKPDNSNSNFMVNLQGQYCLVSSSTVLFGSLDATSITINTSPKWISKIPGVEMVSSAIYSDGSFSCRYTSSGDNSSRNMFLAIAFGSSLNNEKPSYHGPNNYLKSAVSVNLMAIQRFSSGSSPNNLRKGHGILMTLAWLLFATCGIFMSRYMKPFLKKKIAGKDAWFRMHQFFMSSAVICFVIGLILILVDLKGKWSAYAGAHHILGLTAIILGLIQPCIALLRCAPDHENRFIFNWVHRTIGVVAWFVAEIAIIFGLKLLSINYVAVVVFIIVVFALFVLLDLILIRNKSSSDSKPHVTYSSTQFDMNTESKENKTNEDVSMLFMVVLYAFVTAVAIAVAVFIGKS